MSAGPRRRLLLTAVVLAGTSVGSACAASGGAADEPVRVRESGTGAPALSDADVWLSFERSTTAYDGGTGYPDANGGPYVGRVVVANGGRVSEAAGASGTGTAVTFPAACQRPSGCPRAMVEVAPSPALNPGSADFEFGASVWLAADQTSTGSNIVQQGRFGTAGGQWKLQVDTLGGQPSCVVRASEGDVVVRSPASIADSEWHQVVCRRDARGLAITVDGSTHRKSGPTGAVDNGLPVRIGSPGVGDHDDQFHGRVDDVFLRIGSSG